MQYQELIPVVGEPVPPGTQWNWTTSHPWHTERNLVFDTRSIELYVEGFRWRCPLPDPLIAALQAENARLRAALKKIVDMESQTHIPSGQRFWTATTIADDALRVSPSPPAVAGPAEIPSL